MYEFSKIIEAIRRIEGFKSERAVGERLEMKSQNLAGYKVGNKIPYERLLKYCNEKGLNFQHFLENPEEEAKKQITGIDYSQAIKDAIYHEDEEESSDDKYVLIPRYDVVAKGGPGGYFPENEEIIEQIPFKEHYLREVLNMDPENLVIVNIVGDSMYPFIREGDIVIVNLTHKQLGQDGYYVINHNGYLRVKKLQLLISQQKILVSSVNPEYKDEYIDKDTEEDMIIVGKVVWLGKRIA